MKWLEIGGSYLDHIPVRILLVRYNYRGPFSPRKHTLGRVLAKPSRADELIRPTRQVRWQAAVP